MEEGKIIFRKCGDFTYNVYSDIITGRMENYGVVQKKPWGDGWHWAAWTPKASDAKYFGTRIAAAKYLAEGRI